MTPVPREHLRRVQEAIGDDDVPVAQRRAHHLLDQLHVARDVEQHLRLGHQLEVAGVAPELADRLGDARGILAVGADVAHRQAARRERRRDLVRQRGLAAAVDAFEDDEHQNVTPTCTRAAT